MIRRLKELVEHLPDFEEIVILVELTAEQRVYYKSLQDKTICALIGGNGPQTKYLQMELRKLCCHPVSGCGFCGFQWLVFRKER